MNHQEAQALIVAGGVYLKRYKAANSALKETKATLLDYLEDNNLEDVEGPETGAGVRKITRTGNRELNFAIMEDELIVWLAREGILAGTMAKFDELPNEQRTALAQYISQGAGTTYVDFYFPAWGSTNQAKKEQARAARPAPAPMPVSMAEHQLGKDAAIAAGTAVTNPPKAAQRQQGAAQPANQSPSILTCPEHPEREPKPSKWGGFYCTGKTDDGYCNWTSKKKAS